MIVNIVASYLEDLSATHPICNELGNTLTFGTNLFIGIEPTKSVDTLTLIPYGGKPPNVDNQRQEAALQLRLRTSSRYKSLSVQQACIDNLNCNQLNGEGYMRAINSVPLIIKSEDNDKWIVSVSNYTVKYIK